MPEDDASNNASNDALQLTEVLCCSSASPKQRLFLLSQTKIERLCELVLINSQAPMCISFSYMGELQTPLVAF